jgi:hypothetical protein
MNNYYAADAMNQIPEEDRLDVFSEQEQPIALEDIEVEKVHHASIKIPGHMEFTGLRSHGNEGASRRKASRSFGKDTISAQVKVISQGRSDGETRPRIRRGTGGAGVLRGDRNGQTYLRSREDGGQGRRESRGERERRLKEEAKQDEMDEIAGNDEFERLDNFFDKMMLGEFEQLQEALISGPREQVYERLDQRKFEQNILEPTPTISRELSKSQGVAVTAALLGLPSSQAPVRASPAAQRAISARRQRRMEQQGEYRRWLPNKIQNLSGTDFAKLSGRAPVIGLQYLIAKKPEIELKYREITGMKIRTFLKKSAPELSGKSINPAEFHQQQAVSPHRKFLYIPDFFHRPPPRVRMT